MRKKINNYLWLSIEEPLDNFEECAASHHEKRALTAKFPDVMKDCAQRLQELNDWQKQGEKVFESLRKLTPKSSQNKQLEIKEKLKPLALCEDIATDILRLFLYMESSVKPEIREHNSNKQSRINHKNSYVKMLYDLSKHLFCSTHLRNAIKKELCDILTVRDNEELKQLGKINKQKADKYCRVGHRPKFAFKNRNLFLYVVARSVTPHVKNKAELNKKTADIYSTLFDQAKVERGVMQKITRSINI